MEEAGHYPSGPHRGYKFSAYEGGLRVPLIAHWPAVIEAGTTSGRLVGLNDLMATFADIIGEEVAPEHGPDSISFAPVFHNNNAPATRQNLIMQSALEVFAFRDGDWKLILGPGSGARGIQGNRPAQEGAWEKAVAKLGENPSESDLLKPLIVQLYNLAKDPHEDQNLAKEMPGRVGSMVARLREQVQSGRSNPGSTLDHQRSVRIHQRLPDFDRDSLN